MTALTLEEALVRAHRGAAFLDARPEATGWRERISAKTVTLNDPRLCPVGARFGTYYQGKQALSLTFLRAEWLGFNADGRDLEHWRADLDTLTRAWRIVLDEPSGGQP